MARSEALRSDVVDRESIELKEDSDEVELTDPRRGRSAAGALGSSGGWSFWVLSSEVTWFWGLGLLIGVIGIPCPSWGYSPH